MAVQARQRSFTPEEYLMLERQAERKSEYLAGQIYSMAGAGREHNLITTSVVRQRLPLDAPEDGVRSPLDAPEDGVRSPIDAPRRTSDLPQR